MVEIALNILLTSTILSVVLWISKTDPTIGGFLISLPISTLIVLALSRIQTGDAGNTFALAKSIFVGFPLTALFFVPFLLSEKLNLGFWTSYFIGFSLLGVSYGLHKWIMERWVS